VQLPRLLRSVAVAAEHLVPVDAAPYALGGREDPLDVDGAVARRLGRVVDHHLPEVVSLPEGVRRQHPDLDEVLEVAEPVQRLQLLDGFAGEGVVVAPGDLEQRRRAHGRLEVDVELDLRVRHSIVVASCLGRQRFSSRTDSQIVSS
jgi:hypothetical protein